MFTRCLVCATSFEPNDQLEYLPNGTRVAFDPGRGRLWAVCSTCKRWSLTPIEDRWEALEELGIVISIPDPKGETREATPGDDGGIVQTAIFNNEGINWVSFTYRCQSDIGAEKIIPKDDEIEEARWFSREEALYRAVSIFDIEAIQRTN